MACGLPVVSVEWEELLNINSPAILCQNKDKFLEGIVNSLEKSKDSNIYIQYAAKQAWSQKVSNLIEFLN